MKLRLLTAGLLACLTLGLFQEEASAESNWASPCKSYGEIKPNENPTFQQANCLLTNAAIDADIPPEVVKAVATQENGWKQFDENGKPIIAKDGGIGLMQITNLSNVDPEKLNEVKEKLAYDIYFNIETGIDILNSMYKRKDLPEIKGAGRQVIENWYFPVMAYNGIKPVNSPLYQQNTDTHQAGDKNTTAYQEKVFGHIEQYSFLNADFLKSPILGEYPFQTTDFQYDTTSDNNIEFLKKEYTLTDQMHTSTHLFKPGDKVVTTQNDAKLRQKISTPDGAQKLPKGTRLIISDTSKYDNINQFVWYPVTSATDSKVKGFISSAYITKAASVNTVDNNDTSISGTAPAKATIAIMKGNTKIGSATSNPSGKFSAKITAKQKAGTTLTVTFKDPLNTVIPSVKITVLDKTAPKPPTIDKIKKTTKIVTVKTEAYATVQLKLGSKLSSPKKANKSGIVQFVIKLQKVGTNVTVTATDTAKNTSKATKTTVQAK